MNDHFNSYEFLFEADRDSCNKAKQMLNIYNSIKPINAFIIQPFMQGWGVHKLKEMIEQNTLTSDGIKKIFAAPFLNIQMSVSFMDGYYSRIPEIYDYKHQIDSAHILCIQGDFIGAINTLLPVIEGSIRNFETNYNSKQPAKIIGVEKLLTGIKNIQSRRLEIKRERVVENDKLTDEQKNVLHKLNREYESCWFSMFTDYFEHSLYLKTNGGVGTKSINRNDIFHGFLGYEYYSFESYLKLYGCLQFLAWALLECNPLNSIFAEGENMEFLRRWELYEKIRVHSREAYQLKKQLLQDQYLVDDDYEKFLLNNSKSNSEPLTFAEFMRTKNPISFLKVSVLFLNMRFSRKRLSDILNFREVTEAP